MYLALARTLMCCALALAGAVALGCGSEETPGASANLHLSEEATALFSVGMTGEDEGHCTTAEAIHHRLWQSMAVIARCRPTKKGDSVTLLIERYSLHQPWRELTLSSFRSRPEILYEGVAFEARDKCMMRRGIVGCRISLKGPSQVIENVEENREGECRSGVYVAEIRPSECEGGSCNGPPVVRTLFEGRPRRPCERL